MVVAGLIVVVLDIAYIIGSAWIIIRFRREWNSLKRGIVNNKLTDRNMSFMDALVGEAHPLYTGFIAAVAWPKFAYDIWRQRRKDRA